MSDRQRILDDLARLGQEIASAANRGGLLPLPKIRSRRDGDGPLYVRAEDVAAWLEHSPEKAAALAKSLRKAANR